MADVAEGVVVSVVDSEEVVEGRRSLPVSQSCGSQGLGTMLPHEGIRRVH